MFYKKVHADHLTQGDPDDPKELLFNLEEMLKGFGALMVLGGFLVAMKTVYSAIHKPAKQMSFDHPNAYDLDRGVDRFNAACMMLVFAGAALAVTVWGYTQEESATYKVLAALASAATGLFLMKAGENAAKSIEKYKKTPQAFSGGHNIPGYNPNNGNNGQPVANAPPAFDPSTTGQYANYQNGSQHQQYQQQQQQQYQTPGNDR
jgi:hypothetical protein